MASRRIALSPTLFIIAALHMIKVQGRERGAAPENQALQNLPVGVNSEDVSITA